MWLPGNCQPTSQTEAAPPDLSHRKGSIDLVRQAQFAACSYLGFDPYHEKHKNGHVHQVSMPDTSIPVELHLHQHHHHHCRENDEVLKRPPLMAASADTPLGVGGLLSICDHIQTFQDAWQNHNRGDERSQKAMLHGSLIKRDSSFAGFEGGLPLNDDRKEKPMERSYPDRYWNGGMAPASAMPRQTVTGLDNCHVNTAARISHWECSVVQEEKLNKGSGARCQAMDAPGLLANSPDFGWTSGPKHTLSTHMVPRGNNTKGDHSFLSHSGDTTIPSAGSHESFSGSNRKSGSTVTKRKKSLTDMDMGNDQLFFGAFDTSAKSYIDTKNINHPHTVQVGSMGLKKVPGLDMITLEGQPATQGFSSQEGCGSQGGETVVPKFKLVSLETGSVDGIPLKQSTMSNCEGCNCQQSVTTPRPSSSREEKKESIGVQTSVHGLLTDFKRDLDCCNVFSKQYDLSEKIISLDESKNGDAQSPQLVRNQQDKGSLRISNPILLGKDTSSFPAAHVKVSEDLNGDNAWHDARNNRGKTRNCEKSIKNLEKIMPANDEALLQNGLCVDKGQATQNFELASTNIGTTRMTLRDSQRHGCSTSQKVRENANESFSPNSDMLSKEYSSQGISRVRQRLECEKSRHESSKKELEQVKRDYDDILRDLGSCKDMHNPSVEGDGLSRLFALVQEQERKQLTLEFEARLAAQEKARIYEQSAEVAESRLLQLLDERTKLHLKFDEELERKEAERLRLHSLFKKERAKSDAAKKELLDLKEKFAFLMTRAPLSPRVKCEDSHEVFVSPKHLFKLSDTLEKRDVFEKREESLKLAVCGSISECGNVQKRTQTIEDDMNERCNLLKDREKCILQQVRQQEMQLETAEDVFQELEKNLKHVEPDKTLLNECLESVQSHYKDSKLIEKSTQTRTWNDGVFEKYNCVYQCPVFEHSHPKAKSRKNHDDETSETDSDERVSRRKETSEDQTDTEIQQLTEELKVIGADLQNAHKIPGSNENFFARLEESIHAEHSVDKQMTDGALTNQMLRKRLKEKTVELNQILVHHAKELQKLQNSSSQAHELNKQYASNLAKAETKLSELQIHYDGLLASVESRLQEAQEEVKGLQRAVDTFRYALSESEEKASELKDSAAHMEAELTELRRTEQKLRTEKDVIENEKLDVSVKLEEVRKEVNEQTSCVAEYLSINEELLEFAQRKENEVASLTQELQALQQEVSQKANVDAKLQVDFEKAQRELNDVQKAYNAIESENKLLKAKISENNLQLLQQEGTIATLTKQMADIMQGRDSILEEVAQFHGYLQSAKYKELELENKLRQSSSHNKDLEERLQSMESEALKSRSELADLKKKNSRLQKAVEDKDLDAVGVRKAVNDLRKKVQDLEEEVMLKEGQIAIISSQSRESYDPF